MFRRKSLTAAMLTLVVLASMLGACAAPETEVVEVTRLVEKEVEVTRVVEKPAETTKLDETPRIAVISAFGAELEVLLNEADIKKTHALNGTAYNIGTLRGNDVVMFLSGVSMINAAMKTQVAIDHFNVERIVYSGIAGGVNPNYNIGDVVVPLQWGEYLESYFARETEPGVFTPPAYYEPEFPNYMWIYPSSVSVVQEGEEPDHYTEKFWFQVDLEMLETAEKVAAAVDLEQCPSEEICLQNPPQVHVGGHGVSGQSFVDNAEFREFAWDTFEADALDMETAAVAHVAFTNKVPYLAFRSLSDLAGGGPGENEIGTFFQIAADNSAELVLAFLETWATGEVPEQTEEGKEPFRVAFVYVGPVGDLGWTYAHDQGRLKLKEELPYVETAYSELVVEGPDATRVIEQYAEEGYDMVFATSFGYMDSVMEVAEKYPNVLFEHCTGYKTADNVAIYDGRGYEGWYLAGITAGYMTESNVLGYVAPYPIPEVVRNINAFTLGAQSVNPEVTVHPIWIMDWFNPPAEREAAQALLDTGADVIARESDSTEPDKLAQEAGVYAVGYNAISEDVAPDAVLTAPIWDWGIYYADTVEKAYNSEWEPHAYWGHMSDGIMELAPFGDMVPQDVQDDVISTKEVILNGNLHPFTGPISDNNGELRVAEGEVMTDEVLLSFDWLVKGVVGTVPE